MPYSFRSRAARENRRLWMIVGSVAAILLIAFLFFRSGEKKESGPPPRVLGTRDSTYLQEEIGVFEYDTTGYGDVPTTPLAGAPAETIPSTPAQPREVAPTREKVLAAQKRAVTDLPAYRAEVEKKPQSALAMNNYAWSLHLAGKHAEAETQLREVIRIAPDRAIAYANLGEALWKQGKNEEAVTMYRRFLEMNEDPRREKIAQAKIAQITQR